MIINIYSVTRGGSLKIDQVCFIFFLPKKDVIDYRHVFTSDLAKNRYMFHFGDLPKEI